MSAAVIEFGGSILALFFIVFNQMSQMVAAELAVHCLTTTPATYFAAIAARPCRHHHRYLFASSLRLPPPQRAHRPLETGIQNGPPSIAIIAFTFAATRRKATWRYRALLALHRDRLYAGDGLGLPAAPTGAPPSTKMPRSAYS